MAGDDFEWGKDFNWNRLTNRRSSLLWLWASAGLVLALLAFLLFRNPHQPETATRPKRLAARPNDGFKHVLAPVKSYTIDPIRDAAFARMGEAVVLSSAANSRLRMMATATGHAPNTIGPASVSNAGQHVAVSADGKLVAVQTKESPNSIAVMDTAQWRLRTLLTMPLEAAPPDSVPPNAAYSNHGVTGAVFSPNAKLLAVARQSEVFVWSVQTGKVLSHIVAPTTATVQATPEPGVHLKPFKLDDGRQGFRSDSATAATAQTIVSLTFYPTGTAVACGMNDGRVVLIDAKQARVIKSFEPGADAPEALAFSPTGKLLALAYRQPRPDATVRVAVLNTKTGEVVRSVAGGMPMAWSPDGHYLATTPENGTTDSAYVWDADSGRGIGKLTRGDQVLGLAFTRDSRLVRAAGAQRLVEWKLPER